MPNPSGIPASQLNNNEDKSASVIFFDKASAKASEYEWVALGSGSYNVVWRSNFAPAALVVGESYQGPWVLKYPISSVNPILAALNESTRGVRIWNSVNKNLPKAGLYKSGWVAPFIANTRPATDEEVALKVIAIYREQRRIVLDAATGGNFLTRLDTNEVILVDVDLALKRRGSFASMEYAKNLEQQFSTYWNDEDLRKSMPLTLDVTQNLLFLEEQLDEQAINYLCDNNHITLSNVSALTWLRTQGRSLSMQLFLQIATLNENGLLSEVLLDSLSSDANLYAPSSTPAESHGNLKSSISSSFNHSFFAPDPPKKKFAENYCSKDQLGECKWF